jgi:hypothetical protein
MIVILNHKVLILTIKEFQHIIQIQIMKVKMIHLLMILKI